MKKNNYIVYKHTLKIDGRVYIGQTCNVKNRWCGNGMNYKRCPYFWNAISKHGWDAFDHEIILESLDKDEADVYEEMLISQYRSNEKGYGFNIRSGGSRGKFPQEVKRKMGAKRIGREITEETRRKMSESRTGTKLSVSHRKNIGIGNKKSAAAKAHLKEMTEACKKPVVCVETGMVFESVGDAANNIGVVKSNISSCLHGYQHTSGGYHWEYKGGVR